MIWASSNWYVNARAAGLSWPLAFQLVGAAGSIKTTGHAIAARISAASCGSFMAKTCMLQDHAA